MTDFDKPHLNTPVANLPAPDDLRALGEKWRERERVWLHKADTTKSIMYADRCSGLAEVYASCADELFALAAAQQTPQEPRLPQNDYAKRLLLTHETPRIAELEEQPNEVNHAK